MDVEIYKTIRGKKLEKYIAYMEPVNNEMRTNAYEIGATARAILAAHRDQGHSEIVVEKGKLDYYVSLDDTRGHMAAAAIEFGRGSRAGDEGLKINPRRRGAVAPLRRALEALGAFDGL